MRSKNKTNLFNKARQIIMIQKGHVEYCQQLFLSIHDLGVQSLANNVFHWKYDTFSEDVIYSSLTLSLGAPCDVQKLNILCTNANLEKLCPLFWQETCFLNTCCFSCFLICFRFLFHVLYFTDLICPQKKLFRC